MKVSVILACFNGAAMLEGQLEALCRQGWTSDLDLICVDNGAANRSVELIESLRPRLPPLQIVRTGENSGKPHGAPQCYVAGLRASTADAFIFCAADDEVADDYVGQMAQALSQHDFVAATLETRKFLSASPAGDGQGAEPPRPDTPPDTPPDTTPGPMAPRHLPPIAGGAIGFTRKAWEAAGDPRDAPNDRWDFDFTMRIQFAGYHLHHLPNAIVHSREQERDTLGSRINQARERGRTQALMARSYAPRPFPRRLASLGWNFVRSGATLAVDMVTRRQPLKEAVAPVARLYGQAEVFLNPRRTPPPER